MDAVLNSSTDAPEMGCPCVCGINTSFNILVLYTYEHSQHVCGTIYFCVHPCTILRSQGFCIPLQNPNAALSLATTGGGLDRHPCKHVDNPYEV